MTTKILVIDDSMMVRKQVTRALATAGFTIMEAADGVDALAQLKAAPDARLIVCDVNMPRMGGIEFLESRSSMPELSHIPVVMLTTEGQAELIQRARTLGAKGWLVKPFKPDQLLAIATKLTAAA